jgi:integrase/recombinase XerD
LGFLNRISEGAKQQTKSIRYSGLSSFFNFIRINIDHGFQNPCDNPILRKMFRPKAVTSWDIIEKDVIDEIIFKTDKTRNRLIL